MKNVYYDFNIKPTASLLEICRSYQSLCIKYPKNIFYYTKILRVLANSDVRSIYNTILTQVDLRFWLSFFSLSLSEEEEYLLANFIYWLEDFREFVYDSKFYSNNKRDFLTLDKWYDEMEDILVKLKEKINSFYLG